MAHSLSSCGGRQRAAVTSSWGKAGGRPRASLSLVLSLWGRSDGLFFNHLWVYFVSTKHSHSSFKYQTSLEHILTLFLSYFYDTVICLKKKQNYEPMFWFPLTQLMCTSGMAVCKSVTWQAADWGSEDLPLKSANKLQSLLSLSLLLSLSYYMYNFL